MNAAVRIPVRDGAAIVQAVAELAPIFRERLPRTEAERSVPLESIQALIESGMYRMLVPKSFGGLELSIRDFVNATAAAAHGCPSTGWLAGQMSFAPLVLAGYSQQVQATVWRASPDVVLVSSSSGLTAVPAPGGFVVNGRAPFTSGVNHSEWLYMGVGVIHPDAAPEMRFFLVPRSQVTIEDTWHTGAMRGTGSNTVILDSVFVAEEFTLRAKDAREGTGPGIKADTSYLYRLPWVTIVPLIYTSTMLGATQAAYDTVVPALRDKRSPGGQRAAESEELQIDLTLISAKIDGARTLLLSLADRADSGREYTLHERAASTRTACFIAVLLMEAIDGVLAIGGTTSFGDTNFIQQAWRDVHFAGAHQALSKRLQASRFARLELDAEEAVLPMFY